MASKQQSCEYCEFCEKDSDYPFGKFCTVHHDHCDNRENGLTQKESNMLHRSWHRMVACLERITHDSKDGKLWLLSWQVGAVLRGFDYLPTPPRHRNWKPKNTHHKVWIGATNSANDKVRFRKIQEMQKMLDTLQVLKQLQNPSTHVPGSHPVISQERKRGL